MDELQTAYLALGSAHVSWASYSSRNNQSHDALSFTLMEHPAQF